MMSALANWINGVWMRKRPAMGSCPLRSHFPCVARNRSRSIHSRQLTAPRAFVIALSNPAWSGIATRRTIMRKHREVTGKAEIVLQQISRARILGFLQDAEQIQQPLTCLRDSRTRQLANLDQLATLGSQPLDGAVRKNLEMLAVRLLAGVQNASGIDLHGVAAAARINQIVVIADTVGGFRAACR